MDGAGLIAGLRPGGVGAGLEPSGTTKGPIGFRIRIGARCPWLPGPFGFKRGRPGPRLAGGIAGWTDILSAGCAVKLNI